MDTAWIQVFVLTLSECIAPSGKTVCQEQETQYVFYDRQDCEAVLNELVSSKANDETVIVNPDRSRCLPSARQRPVYASLEEANQRLADIEGWGIIPPGQEKQGSRQQANSERMAYLDRLQSLPECDEARSVTPCKVGQIIIESPPEEEHGKKVEVWHKKEN
ncbi:MAG TPA: hypothetical protein VE175_04225 [Woeseiaceae bacterium]|jgi:hypothetical protein|nr:hypothetical protein [Woeseiaceae bacterium]